MLKVAIACLLFGCALALEDGFKIRGRAPGATRIARAIGRQRNVGAKKITPVFSPQMILNMGTRNACGRGSDSGSASQEFLGCNIDVGTGDTWIVDITASQPDPAPWQYASSNSTTYKKSSYAYSTNVADVDGNVAKLDGIIADDVFNMERHKFTMNFGHILSVTPNQQMAEIPDIFSTGRCGLGFHSSDYLDMFMPKLMSTLPTNSSRSLSVVIHDCMLNKNAEEVLTEFTVGYIDSTYCNTSTTVTVPLIDRYNWNFQITSYQIGNLSSTRPAIAKLDTSELMTGVPQAVYDYVYTLTNATADPAGGWPFVDCNQQFPHLNFNVTTDSFSVHSHYYIYKDFQSENTPCRLMLYPLNGGGFLPSWSFGYVWMYKKCMTLDYGLRTVSFTDYNADFCEEI